MKLYSKEYSKQLKELHQNSSAFGSKATEFKKVKKIIDQYQLTRVLDYGCGKGALFFKLKEEYPNAEIQGYDPGQAQFEALPHSTELVTSSDVLEHVEPDLLDSVLKHIYELSEKFSYLEISCFPAKKKLPDGRNAHLIIENPDWWKEQILKYWKEEQILRFDVADKGELEREGKKVPIIYAHFLLSKE